MKQYRILDTTMRDGEQSPGIVFGKDEKTRILQMLVAAGVDEAEIGTPVMGTEEMDIISHLVNLQLPIRLFSWNRALKKDIDQSIQCGISNLFISSPVSDIQIKNKIGKDRDWVLKNLKESVVYARGKGCYVACGLEDSTRADIDWLIFLINELKLAGAERVRISDTVGICTPDVVYNLIKRIKKATDIAIEIHTHNDFGMATANALSALNAGAEIVDTTLLGIGERAGNASLEEIATALHVIYKAGSNIKHETLRQIATEFSEMISRPISPWKPVVGENVFTHESGIHVDGIIKNPMNYEPYSPELVGATRKFVIGKHSGRKAIEFKFEELGIRLSESELENISVEIKNTALFLKRSLSDSDLMEIYNFIKNPSFQQPENMTHTAIF